MTPHSTPMEHAIQIPNCPYSATTKEYHRMTSTNRFSRQRFNLEVIFLLSSGQSLSFINHQNWIVSQTLRFPSHIFRKPSNCRNFCLEPPDLPKHRILMPWPLRHGNVTRRGEVKKGAIFLPSICSPTSKNHWRKGQGKVVFCQRKLWRLKYGMYGAPQ